MRNLHCAKICKEDYFIQNGIDGDYYFVGDSGLKNKSDCNLYKIKCKKCGNVKLLDSDLIQRNTYYHNKRNCGEKVYLEKIGDVYDDMKIISYIGISETKNKSPIYMCQCLKCGRVKQMQMSNISMHKGTSHKYCSLNIENDKYIDEFRSRWANMRDRTTNPNNKRYHCYGGRGIKSDDFELFVDFYDAMYESFIEHVNQYGVHNTTLERKDVNLDYTKDNLTWATWSEQANNKQDTVYFKIIMPDGSEKIEYGIGRYEQEHNLSHNFIFNRIYGIVDDNSYNGMKFEYIGNNRILEQEVY